MRYEKAQTYEQIQCKMKSECIEEEGTKEMLEEKIKRINELYRKSKAEGLTEEELMEQKVLRAEYIDAFKRNLRSQTTRWSWNC